MVMEVRGFQILRRFSSAKIGGSTSLVATIGVCSRWALSHADFGLIWWLLKLISLALRREGVGDKSDQVSPRMWHPTKAGREAV